jgi:GH43 family beta-xylosidase
MGELIHNPLIRSIPASPDPYIFKQGDFYYFCHSEHGATIWVWRSPTLAGLDTTPDKCLVWRPPAEGPLSKNVWAPELHFFDGKWYLYFCADDGKNENHRMYALQSISDDPLGPYGDPVRLQWQDEDFWGIDATIFRNEHDGAFYMIWSGWPGHVDEVQHLYIAPMSSPMAVSGPRRLLSQPELPWESWINEGPSTIQRDGKICVVYSANESWTARYCLGLLYIDSKADLLDRANWTKKPEPILVADAGVGVYGPGHNSFFTGPDGADWIAYHVKTSPENGWEDRMAWVQPLLWDSEGLPYVGKPVETPESVPTK